MSNECCCWDREGGFDPVCLSRFPLPLVKGDSGGKYHNLGDNGCWVGIKKKVHIIMDLGFSGQPIVERYGVWRLEGNTAVEVIETSDNLEELKRKYNCNQVIILSTT